MGEFAESVMERRQAGYPIEVVLSAIDPNNMLAQQVVAYAYSRPLFLSEELADTAIADFKEEITWVCYEQTTNSI